MNAPYRPLSTFLLFLLYGTFCSAWPRPYDDWKNGFFYLGSALAVLLCLRNRRDQPPFKVTVFHLGMACYIVAILLSLVSTTAHYEAILAGSRLLLWVGLASVVAQYPLDDWKWLMQVGVIVAALISLINFSGLVETIWPDRFLLPPIGHVSYFGDFMALHIPMAAYLTHRAARRWAQGLWGLMLLLLLIGLWFSGTRASGMGILCALLLWGTLSFRFRLIALRRLVLTDISQRIYI